MARTVDTKEYLDTVCQLLEEDRQVSIPIAGNSMCPFLHPGDTALLARVSGQPKPGEVYLFLRPDGSYVLHRLIRVGKDGTLWLLGDNQADPEPVQPNRLRAQVLCVRRKGKECAPGDLLWWVFAKLWRRLWRLRRPIGAILRKLRR